MSVPDPTVVDLSAFPPLPPAAPMAEDAHIPPPLELTPQPTAAPIEPPPPPPPPPVEPVYFARFDADGRYTTTGTVPADSITLDEPDVYVGKVDLATQYHTVDGPVDMPAKPAPEYEFNYKTKTWGGDIEKLRAQRHKEIEAERDRMLNEPTLDYNGIVVDADAQSKQNLQDKITATNSRIAKGTPTPPQMLVWKDHANTVHAFADLATYRDWLQGFVIALENRGMQAWSWSWNKKDALNALTTFEDVLAFQAVDPPPAPTPAPTPATALLPAPPTV